MASLPLAADDAASGNLADIATTDGPPPWATRLAPGTATSRPLRSRPQTISVPAMNLPWRTGRRGATGYWVGDVRGVHDARPGGADAQVVSGGESPRR